MSYIADTYSRFPISVSSAQGIKVWDSKGKEYIDTFMGIGVLLFGHNYPPVIRALNHPATCRGGGFRKKFGQTTLILSGWSKQPLACRTLKSTRLLLRSMFSAPLQSAFIIVP